MCILISFLHFVDECFTGHKAVHPPSIKCLTKIAKDLKIDLSDEELKEHQGVLKATDKSHLHIPYRQVRHISQLS